MPKKTPSNVIYGDFSLFFFEQWSLTRICQFLTPESEEPCGFLWIAQFAQNLLGPKARFWRNLGGEKIPRGNFW